MSCTCNPVVGCSECEEFHGCISVFENFSGCQGEPENKYDGGVIRCSAAHQPELTYLHVCIPYTENAADVLQVWTL